jgi:hypothetical protein
MDAALSAPAAVTCAAAAERDARWRVRAVTQVPYQPLGVLLVGAAATRGRGPVDVLIERWLSCGQAPTTWCETT